MNCDEIADHLCQQGYSAHLENDSRELIVRAKIADRSVTLRHVFPEAIRRLPQFFLAEVSSYGTLAHIQPVKASDFGLICAHDQDSISVNFEVPHLAYEASLERNLALVERVITDPEWNRAELLREFRSNWALFCSRCGSHDRWLYFACEPQSVRSGLVKGPSGKHKFSISNHYLGLGDSQAQAEAFDTFRSALNWNKRPAAGKALVLNLTSSEFAPTAPGELPDWYLRSLDALDAASADQLDRFRRQKSKEFWLIFTANTRSGRTWFALHFCSKTKAKLPTTIADIGAWTLKPIAVRPLDRDSVVPRSGGEVSMAEKSVLLIGCGSVGSELAHRLASTGLGHLRLSDPDNFSEDNLYRHSLAIWDIGFPKSLCLATDLRRKYPWIDAIEDNRRLEAFDNVEELNRYDLIIVAIGAPTIERQFHDFVTSHAINTPVMNVWLEAYGVGGHATLDAPDSKGCLRCAYVDPDTLTRGLASNLNFLAPNQDVTVNHGGCGNLSLPYSAIASNHTATMAADLSARYLAGDINTSSKLVGRVMRAKHRPRVFSFPIAIANSTTRSRCCHYSTRNATFVEDEYLYYEGFRRKVWISERVWRIWKAHRQIYAHQPESFGVLIGSTSKDRRDVYIEEVTTPMPGDQQSRNSFDLRDPGHQKAVDAAHKRSGKSQIYMGTWHTHPQPVPLPSGVDKADWRRCLRRNEKRSLVFVIAGTEQTRVFVPWGRWFRTLSGPEEAPA